MSDEPLTITSGLLGLVQSCKTIRQNLQCLKRQLDEAKLPIDAVLDEMAPLESTLPNLSKHLDTDQAVRNITVDEFSVVVAGTAKSLSALETYSEDLLAATSPNARPYQRATLANCGMMLRSNASALQASKMALLLTVQLLTAFPTEPAPVLQRKRQSLRQRIHDMLANDPMLASRVNPELVNPPQDDGIRNQLLPLLEDSTTSLKSTSTKSSWRSALRRRFSSKRAEVPTSPISASSLSTTSPRWSSSSSINSASSSVTSQASVSSGISMGASKLPLAAVELANGYHYIVQKSPTGSNVRDFATASTSPTSPTTPSSPSSESKPVRRVRISTSSLDLPRHSAAFARRSNSSACRSPRQYGRMNTPPNLNRRPIVI